MKFLYLGWLDIPKFLRILVYIFAILCFIKIKIIKDAEAKIENEKKKNIRKLAHSNLLKMIKKNKERALEDIKMDFILCQKKYAKLETQQK